MLRTAKRAQAAPGLEPLEPRTLLTTDSLLGTQASPNPALSLLVRFLPDAPVASIVSSIGGKIDESFPDGPTVITLNPGADRATTLNLLHSNPEVAYAEADQSVHVQAVPNDPYFSLQWGLNNINDVDIDAPQAWDISAGSPATVVAVLDSGIDLSNPDFAGRLWTNLADGTHGWNFVAGNTNIRDDNGHGTHVSGILAATGNNGTGVAGVDWNARIMPLKIIDALGNGSTDAAVSAIYWAAQHGAKVINASWDGPDYSQAMVDAINYAGTLGVVFVAAAGNESANNDVVPTYPADNRLPNLISVAAVDAAGNLASFSNFGAHTVDLAAPGVDIWSTIPGSFVSYSGTSMATPFVTGVVSLVIGQNPGLTAAQVVSQVVTSAKPLPSLFGRTVSGGIVDAFRALTSHRISTDFAQGLDPNALNLYRQSTGQWLSFNPSTGATRAVQFGQPGVDIPVPANYDGTGRPEFAVFRTTTAQWFIQSPSGGRLIQFGAPGDIPVPADYDGDGRTDVAVFRPSNATWYVLGTASGPWARQFGGAGIDLPVPADYDGDGRADLAVFRPATAQWFIWRSTSGPIGAQFGPPGLSVAVPADFDGDGRADLAVYVPSTSWWYLFRSTAGPAAFQFGSPGSIPVVSDYDGDAHADLATFQPGNATWSIFRSAAGYLAEPFGAPAIDMPVTAPVLYRFLALGQSGGLKSASIHTSALPHDSAFPHRAVPRAGSKRPRLHAAAVDALLAQVRLRPAQGAQPWNARPGHDEA